MANYTEPCPLGGNVQNVSEIKQAVDAINQGLSFLDNLIARLDSRIAPILSGECATSNLVGTPCRTCESTHGRELTELAYMLKTRNESLESLIEKIRL